jgi:hypothetical protein
VGNAEPAPVLVLLDVAELDGHAEHANRQAQLVVLGEVDEVGLRHAPSLLDLDQLEIRLVDLHRLAPLAQLPRMFQPLDGQLSIRDCPQMLDLEDKRMAHTLADRLRSRTRQMGLNAAQLAALAGVNRSFV